MKIKLGKTVPVIGALAVATVAVAGVVPHKTAIVGNFYGVASIVQFDEDGDTKDATKLEQPGDIVEGAYGMGLGDFDGDGMSDFLMGGRRGGGAGLGILFHKKTSPGEYEEGAPIGAPIIGSRVLDFAVADYNGDGRLDFAVAEYDHASINVYIGNGDGTFTGPDVYQLTFRALGLDSEDINGDGYADFVAAEYARLGSPNLTREVEVFLGDGAGGFTRSTVELDTLFGNNGGRSEEIWGATLSDFDNDGSVDLVVENYFYTGLPSSFSFYRGNGDGTFEAAPIDSGGRADAHSALDDGDFNEDGYRDILATHYDGGVTVWFGNGDGSFTQSELGAVDLGLAGSTYAVSTLPYSSLGEPTDCAPTDCECGPGPDGDGDGISDCDETPMTLVAGESHVRFHEEPSKAFALFTGSMEVPGGLLAPDFRDGTGSATGLVRVHFGGIDAINVWQKDDIPFEVTDFCHQSTSDNREKWIYKGDRRTKVALRWKNSQKYRSRHDVALPEMRDPGNLGRLSSRFISAEESRFRVRWNNKTDLPLTFAIDGVPLATIVDNGDGTYDVISSYDVYDVFRRDGITERKRVVDVVFPGRLGNGEVVAWYADGDPTDGLDGLIHSHEAIDDGTAAAVFYNAGGRFRVKVPLETAMEKGLVAETEDRVVSVKIQVGNPDTHAVVEGETTFEGYTLDGNHWRLREVDEDGVPTLASTRTPLARCATCETRPIHRLEGGDVAGATFEVAKRKTLADVSFLLTTPVNHTGVLGAYVAQLDADGNPSIELDQAAATVALDVRERVLFQFDGAAVLEPGNVYAVTLKNHSGTPVDILGGDHCGAGRRVHGLFSPQGGWHTDPGTLPAVAVRGLK